MNPEITLNARHVIDLSATAPFHFDATMHRPDHVHSTDNGHLFW